MILELGLADERELAELDRAVREHLADPRTLAMQHLLFVARGRKPTAARPAKAADDSTSRSASAG